MILGMITCCGCIPADVVSIVGFAMKVRENFPRMLGQQSLNTSQLLRFENQCLKEMSVSSLNKKPIRQHNANAMLTAAYMSLL